MPKIGGFSKDQYDAYLYVGAEYKGNLGNSHWVSKFNLLPVVATIFNRLAQLILTGEYYDNAALLTRRFGQHEFSKIAEQDELDAAWEIFNRFKGDDELLKVDKHKDVLEQIELDLKEAEKLLNPPKNKEVLTPKPPKKSAPLPKKSEDPEEPAPVDPGQAKVDQPAQNGDAPPPPPPPPPPPAPPLAPPPPAPPVAPNGPPPPPPPPGAPNGPPPPPPPMPTKGLPGQNKSGPPTPVVPARSFKGEPPEPTLKPNLAKDVLEKMDKDQLAKEIKAIDDYLKELKAVLAPIEALIQEEEKWKEAYDNDERDLKSLEKQLAAHEEINSELSQDSQATILGLKVRDDEIIDMPFLSDQLFKDISHELQKSGFSGALSSKFKKSDQLDLISEKTRELKKQVSNAKKSLQTQKDELEKIRKTADNGIPFDQFEKVFAAKKTILEKWQRARKNRQTQLDQLVQGPKLQKPVLAGKTKSLTDVLAANPALVAKYPVLGQIDALSQNHLAAIQFKNTDPDAFLNNVTKI